MLILLLLFIMLCPFNTLGSEQLNRLDKLKAAYMFNFVKFITWPSIDVNNNESSQSANNEPLIFCMQTSEEFTQFFAALSHSQIVGPQKKVIQSLLLKDASRCDLAFLSTRYEDKDSKLNRAVVIQDSKQVESNLSVFTFFQQDKRLRFEIDLQRANQLDLEISSELLKLAEVKQ